MAQGMRFECQPGCTECCTQQGFVYLNDADVTRAAAFVGMSAAEFERRYVYRTRRKMRLRVAKHAHCHFLEGGGCGIHPAKPLQCRTFPFWPELVGSAREWKRTSRRCPGIGKGPLVQIELARGIAEEMREGLPELYLGDA
jgi:Fe-S-cluster containining protein